MEYLARDIMNREVIAVSSDMDLRDLAKLFLERGITGAPVVEKDGSLAGVISQTDLVYHNLTRGDELVIDSNFYQSARMDGEHIQKGFHIEDFNSGVVADVMTPVVHSVSETAKVESVARLMTRKQIHRVIVRKGRKISGIISAIDLLRHHNRLANLAVQKKRPAKKASASAGKQAASKRKATTSARKASRSAGARKKRGRGRSA
jgi:CBS domain-containing protein